MDGGEGVAGHGLFEGEGAGGVDGVFGLGAGHDKTTGLGPTGRVSPHY